MAEHEWFYKEMTIKIKILKNQIISSFIRQQKERKRLKEDCTVELNDFSN